MFPATGGTILDQPTDACRTSLKESNLQTAARLPRRLAAMTYDALLVLALWMVAAATVVIPMGDEVRPGNPLFQLYLLLVCYLYFAIFWRMGGQTLGMKAWRIRLVGIDGAKPSWLQTVIRFVTSILSLAAFGLGYAWSLFDRERRCWHDTASKTRIVLLPRPAAAGT
jgi:uncharacterized RDD family membrane protein YckC